MEGNDRGRCKDDCSSCSVEMDVYESDVLENKETLSHGEACNGFKYFVFSLLFVYFLPF